jgi:hypothetical protein
MLGQTNNNNNNNKTEQQKEVDGISERRGQRKL